MSEEVIELSINETQALRAKLGLPPLRGVPNSGKSSAAARDTNTSAANTNDEELVLSINETNALRAKIGLPPLKTNSSSNKAAGSSQSTAIHIVPTNTSANKEAKQRIEDATAKRLNANSIAALEKENSKFDKGKGEGESALDFATKMLQSKNSTNGDAAKDEKDDKQKKKKKKRKKKLMSNPQLSLGDHDEEDEQQYTAADLQGIKVSHSTSDFIAGSTTVLTLADKSILDINPDTQKASMNTNTEDDNELINANMDNDTQALANLKRKRQIELGAGRARGYAGYDDDEFEELGGIGIAGPGGVGGGGIGGGKSGRGFAIGANGKAIDSSQKDQSKTDIFTSGAINLQSRNPSKVASDFMTDNDDIEMGESREEKLEKERKKQQKILEKLRKKDSKKAKKAAKKKKKRRKVGGDESSEDEGEEGGGGSSSLLANLEATAVGNDIKKRRRQDDGDDAAMDDKDKTSAAAANGEKEDEMIEKRKRFDKIMEKGKVRTDKAFNSSKPLIPSKSMVGHDDGDNDDDDAFLNAALAKARRLKRLKELSGAGGNANGGGGTVKREDAVVQAVAKLKQEEETKAKSEGDGSGEAGGKGGITFEFDEMQEFTRALRAREDQAKRTGKDGKGERSRRGVKATVPGSKDVTTSKGTVKDESTNADTSMSKAQKDEVKVEDVDMEELAQGMEEEDNEEDETSGAFGTTAESAGVGRGMSSFLSMLNQTGEIKKHATKEEMRGRAKDKRTYEDYEQLDLQKVVNVDTNNAHEKDVELANREIKLEYRDDFGRLLTRKEAYRDMCYQFHGHGSSKKNQERRLKQIEREREEASMASRGGVGTLGSLKATQKATGKAFVVHKT